MHFDIVCVGNIISKNKRFGEVISTKQLLIYAKLNELPICDENLLMLFFHFYTLMVLFPCFVILLKKVNAFGLQ